MPLPVAHGLVGVGVVAAFLPSAQTGRWKWLAVGTGPGGGNVSEIQSLTIVARRQTAVMSYQIDLYKPGPLLVSFGEGANRDLLLKQRARLGS